MGYLAGAEINTDKGYCSRNEYKETNWLNDHKRPYPEVSPDSAALIQQSGACSTEMSNRLCQSTTSMIDVAL